MILESRPCPVCGSTDESSVFAESNFDEDRLNSYSFASRKYPEHMHHRLIRCGTCSLLYASPAPEAKDLTAAYREADFDSAAESHDASLSYIGLLKTLLSELPDREGALDIGTGDGAFLERLMEAGFSDIVGVEPSEAPIKGARPDVRGLIHHGIFSAKDYQHAGFRLITCFQTIEHVRDPASVCKDAYGLLKKNGVFVIVAHNYRSFSATILGLKSPIYDIAHLQLFCPISIRYLLDRSGFKNILVRPLTNRYPLQYWVRMLPLDVGTKRRIIFLLKAACLDKARLPLRAGNMAAIGYKI
jgi:SAM-dependent methyltransferase